MKSMQFRFLPVLGRSKRVLAAVSLVGILIAAGVAQAVTPMLDFSILAPTPGSVAFTGGGSLSGSLIQIDSVVGLATPLSPAPQPRTCFGCALSFSTGSYQGSTADAWLFDPGGSISIVGEVDLDGDGVQNDGGAITLLTGSFSDVLTVTAFGATFKLAIGSFTDRKDPSLLALYGLPADVEYAGFLNLSFNASGSPGDAFASTQLLSGDVANVSTPEPGGLLSLAAGLLGCGALLRSRHGG